MASSCRPAAVPRAALTLPVQLPGGLIKDPVVRECALRCGDLASYVLLRDMGGSGSPPNCVLVWICMPAHGKLRTLEVRVPPGTDALLLLPIHQAETEQLRAASEAQCRRADAAEREEAATRREAAGLREENKRLRVSTPAAVLC